MNFCVATKAEKTMSLPGDQVVPTPTIASTHSVTIDSTVEQVWPWVVQIGQDRGGFYSYTLLENLIGCRMKNANQINPDWQNLTQGDAVGLHPRFPPMRVLEIEGDRHLVLSQNNGFVWTWTFVLTRVNNQQTRLIARTRIATNRWFMKLLLAPVMTVGHYLMERKMLLGIKRRAERTCP